MDNNKDFIIELKTLLQKYNASIEVDYDSSSDTYGMYDVKTILYIGNKVLLAVEGWSIEATDL